VTRIVAIETFADGKKRGSGSTGFSLWYGQQYVPVSIYHSPFICHLSFAILFSNLCIGDQRTSIAVER
jgi:hypothetical protein